MLFLFGGVAILAGLLLLGYLFVNANPARLASGVKWAGIALGAVILIALLIVTEGRIAVYLLPLATLFPVLRRLRSMFRGVRGGTTGQSSTVETAFVRMSLDHDTGAMTGTVRAGRFAGARFSELSGDRLVDLLRECRTADEEGARLVEAYLDRGYPDWREAMGGERSGSPPGGSGTDMTVDEAYAILGLPAGATPEAIKAAHHHLMKQFHPDHGGTAYLASKINRARDVLLHR